MFATLAGGLPRPPLADASGDGLEGMIRMAVSLQEEHGLEPLTDGALRWADRVGAIATGLAGFEPPSADTRPAAAGAVADRRPLVAGPIRWAGAITVGAWRDTAGRTSRAVKQCLVGPYSLGRLVDLGGAPRARVTLELADALHHEVVALAAAGCPLVQVDEDEAVHIGAEAEERRLFVEAQRHLTEGVEGTHLSLAVSGGSAEAAGVGTIFDAPYRSHLFDLIAGPDNWRLITRAPGDRGIICAALPPGGPDAGELETLVWAARYAASTGGRGLARVGLAVAAGLDAVDWATAARKVEILGRAGRLAAASRDVLAGELDPRTFGPPRNGPPR